MLLARLQDLVNYYAEFNTDYVNRLPVCSAFSLFTDIHMDIQYIAAPKIAAKPK